MKPQITGIALLGLTGAMKADELPILIFAGQSQALCSGTDAGKLTPAQRAPQDNVLIFNARSQDYSDPEWVQYCPPTGAGFHGDCTCSSTGSFGPEMTAARMISIRDFGGHPVGVFKYAVGATDMYAMWNPRNPGPLYSDMLAMIHKALAELPEGVTGRVCGFFWTQGESDALNGPVTSAAYHSNLKAFIAGVRKATESPNLPFVYSRVVNVWPNAYTVRQAQQSVQVEVHGVSMVNTDDLSRRTSLHYDNAGTMELGRRYAFAFESLLNININHTTKPQTQNER